MALLKEYMPQSTFQSYRARYKECVRMLNGLEKTLERKISARDRRWHIAEEPTWHGSDIELCPTGWPGPET